MGVGAAWEPTRAAQAETAALEERQPLFMGQVTLALQSSSCPPGLCDLFLFPAVEPGYEISAAAFAMKPHSRGSVRLAAREPEAPLEIDHGFLRDERDADVLIEGFEKLRELGLGETTRRYAARELRPGAEVGAAAHVRESARGFFHPVGTCALGRVVDDSCRVLGYENLFVVDASVMPSVPRANTHLSTVAIAERAAERI